MGTGKFNVGGGGNPASLGLASHPGGSNVTLQTPEIRASLMGQLDNMLTLPYVIFFFFFFQLNTATDKIERPVVIIDGKDAKKLMNIVKK